MTRPRLVTVIDEDGEMTEWAIYPVAWCPHCGQDRPCAGPYCQVCGNDREAP